MVDAIFFACGEIGTLCINGTVNDFFVSYEYSFDDTKNTTTLEYNSNFPHDGSLIILIPWLNKVDQKERLKRNLEVQIDGKLTDFKLETINNDSFVVIDTDFDNHTAIVFLSQLSSNTISPTATPKCLGSGIPSTL